MEKNLTGKILFVIVLVLVAVWTLYPPQKTLKQGIDIAGGTSLIYEIDTFGLSEQEKDDLSTKMITVLRRRIDPTDIQNLVWRPLGNTRFEIQVPLANEQSREKRTAFENSLSSLLDKNISVAAIERSLEKPPVERQNDFERYASDSNENLEILNDLAEIHDERQSLEEQRDRLSKELSTAESMMPMAGLNPERVKANVVNWMKLEGEELESELKDFLGENENLNMLTQYVETFKKRANIINQLTDEEFIAVYEQAQNALDSFYLSEDQVMAVLEMDINSSERRQAIEQLKTDYPDRKKEIEAVVEAYNQYLPYKGRLDDPKDIQRMLKGAGILEFRVLPTTDHPDVDADAMMDYVENLKEKGPRYASDQQYIWIEIENIEEFGVGNAVIGEFANKYYVLSSNQKDEGMLYNPGQKTWKLVDARPTQDQHGRRAIGFTLNQAGGNLFWDLTSNNLDRPLCIILDDMAISAPTITARISTNGIITGQFTKTEVDDMVNKLNAGSLPARLIEQPISVKTIGPSIGRDNALKGIQAGWIGLIAVIGCMLVYYTLAGAIADTALLFNILFVLAIMAMVRATFTLPGIAGIILTIGMSVDANVLIFERIREEQEKGASLRIAIKNGYQRAFRTILDANITTFITAAILFWVASEEIKGFAIVLMLGILSSMFTALFVTRIFFDFLTSRGVIKDHLFMLQVCKKPKVNWMALRPVFLTISLLLIGGGLFVFFTRNDEINNKYDIEFTGGTSVNINLKNEMPIDQVREKIKSVAEKMDNPALAVANVYSINKSLKDYEITTTETNKSTIKLDITNSKKKSAEQIQKAIGVSLNNVIVKQNSQAPNQILITTSQTNTNIVRNVIASALPQAEIEELTTDEVVSKAIFEAFGDELEIQRNLQPSIISTERVTQGLVDSYPEYADFIGGAKIVCEIQNPTTPTQIERRFDDLRFKPDMQDITWYRYKLVGENLESLDPNMPVNTFTYLAASPTNSFGYTMDEENWENYINEEKEKITAATTLETSLSRITQIDPSIGAESKTRALIAIFLSLFAIVTYIWIRFGSVRYGLGAITALIHDVCITLGAVTACTYIASTPIGEALLIGDFKINLAMIAAFLTLIGYSLNDTIVVYDRIRENRKKAQLKPDTITESINQTLSRTLLTSFTTFVVVLIMYIFGGEGLRGFTFAIGLGVIVGTYSSMAIASPILLIGSKNKNNK